MLCRLRLQLRQQCQRTQPSQAHPRQYLAQSQTHQQKRQRWPKAMDQLTATYTSQMTQQAQAFGRSKMCWMQNTIRKAS